MPKFGTSKFVSGGRGLSGMLRSFLMCLPAVVLVFCATSAARAESVVGTVSRVQNSAQIGGGPATVGTPVHMNDRLRTGPNGRLEVKFRDNSSLTLGENANLVIDHYVFDPNKSTAKVVLNSAQGAFRFAGGKIEQMSHKDIVVNTPNAAMAVRGTHFWAGPIDGQYGVLLLNGNVRVSNRGGAVTLDRPEWGTDIPLHQKRRH